MRKHEVNIFFYEENYKRVKDLIERRKISSFINELVEKNFQKEEQQTKEGLRQQLIKGYQGRAKKKNLQKTLRHYGENSWEDISAELVRREKKNGKR